MRLVLKSCTVKDCQEVKWRVYEIPGSIRKPLSLGREGGREGEGERGRVFL